MCVWGCGEGVIVDLFSLHGGEIWGSRSIFWFELLFDNLFLGALLLGVVVVSCWVVGSVYVWRNI